MRELAICILFPAVIFLVGYAEGAIFKDRGVACITWFLGLEVASSFCIAYPLTPIRTIAGSGVFLCGVVALVVYYRRKPRQ
jgi:hypothetical protein